MSNAETSIPNNTTQNPRPDPTSMMSRISSLEDNVRVLQSSGGNISSDRTRPGHFHSKGHLIRRLVSLYDVADDLLAEADRRANTAKASIAVNHTNEENRLYKAHKELVRWIPSICEVPVTHLEDALQQVGKGADCARNEDTHKLKVLIVHWLMEGMPKPDPPLSVADKSGRGFYNDATGKLLCPVDYDWTNPSHRNNIRDFHPDFLVTAHSWPAFLYPDGQFDRENPSLGLFKGLMLVSAFKAIFISPTSTEALENEAQTPKSSKKRGRGERRTRPNIANLIGMKTVQPRAIAYAACQLRFALSSCGSWALVDGVFDMHEFYNVIVEWFEETTTEDERKFIQELLLWWNRAVFGPTFAFVLKPDCAASKSVAKSLKKRRILIDDASGQ